MNLRLHLASAGGFSRQCWATALGAIVALIVIGVLPVDSVARSLVARGVGIMAIVLFATAFRGLPKAVRRVWSWVGAFLVITVVADAIFDYQALVLDVRPFPGITDVLYIGAFGCAITGLVTLSRHLNPRVGLPAWIDISIMVIAASAFVGAFVVGSIWTADEGLRLATVLDLLYPALSLILLTALVRLFVLPHPRNPAINLLVASGVCFLLCDLIFSNQLIAGRTPVVAIEVLWAAALICLPLAIMSPGASAFLPVDSTRASEVSPTRQVLICVSAIAVPTLVLLELVLTGSLTANWLLPVIVVLIALVLLRLQLLLRTSERQTLTLAALARTDPLTGLPNKHTWDQLMQERASSLDPGGVCTIAMLDIDNFAQHQEAGVQQRGDLLLISASLAWLSELDVDDVLARSGTDEFALLIRRGSVSQAQEVLRRVLRATPQGLTVSVGAALLRPHEDPQAAQARAASALHAAMAGGRTPLDADQNISS